MEIEKQHLSDEQLEVTQNCGTEPPFSGKLLNEKRQGIYLCVVCRENKITRKKDFSHGMVRIEITCAFCDAHLGHVFNDGPAPSGQRYCVNSLSMEFVANE